MDSLSYTNLGERLQYTMGTSSQPVYITDSYDAQTRRLTEQKTQTGTAQSTVDDLNYGYDNFGNVSSEADTPSAGPADAQCFRYDYLGRLVQAWAQGSTGCASTPSASAEGGAAPYWNTYTYNTVGNLTGITSTTPTGAVTTTTDGYPAAGAARPHAISTSQVTTTSGSTNSSYGYDASGHLSSITATAQNEALTWNDAGQLTQTAITPSGGSARNTNYIYDAGGTLLLTADPGHLMTQRKRLTGSPAVRASLRPASGQSRITNDVQQGNGTSEITIRDPHDGRIVTNQRSTDGWVQRQVAKGRWYKLND